MCCGTRMMAKCPRCRTDAGPALGPILFPKNPSRKAPRTLQGASKDTPRSTQGPPRDPQGPSMDPQRTPVGSSLVPDWVHSDSYLASPSSHSACHSGSHSGSHCSSHSDPLSVSHSSSCFDSYSTFPFKFPCTTTVRVLCWDDLSSRMEKVSGVYSAILHRAHTFVLWPLEQKRRNYVCLKPVQAY